jgi:TRAP-type C4-dicarboxylate transport system permease small subunit
MTRRIQRAAVVGGAGLLVQLLTALHWTPATFVVSAVVGAPLVIGGALMFLRAVWLNMKDKGAV